MGANDENTVRHLHAFARDVDLTPPEWLDGIKFLTSIGRACTACRQEFVLLSDTLGLSSLVNSPTFAPGQSIAVKAHGPEIGIYGRTTDASGKRIPHASIEIWQPDEDGDYDLQKHDPKEMELRGRFFTDNDGRYHLRSIRPLGYMIRVHKPFKELPSVKFNFTLAAVKGAGSGRVGAGPSQIMKKTEAAAD